MQDFERYLNDVVDPTVGDFRESPTSTRHAFIACVVTCHAVDYLAYPRDAQRLRQAFRRNADFKIVDDVGHAFKHVVAGNPNSPRLKADAVVSRPPGLAGVAAIGLSRIGDSTGGVTLSTDPTVELERVIERAVAFLREQIR